MFQKLRSLVFVASLFFLLTISFSPIAAQDENQIQEIARLGHTTIDDLAWSPDGSRIASIAGEYVSVWDVVDSEALEPMMIFTVSSAASNAVSWNARGDEIITFRDDIDYVPQANYSHVERWDVATGVSLGLITVPNVEGQTFRVWSWTADLSRVAIRISGESFQPSAIQIFENNILLRTFEDSGIHSIVLSPDGNRLAIAAVHNGDVRVLIVKIWDIQTGELISFATFNAYYFWEDDLDGWIKLVWSPDGTRIAIINYGRDRVVIMYPSTGHLGDSIPMLQVTYATWSLDNHFIAVGSPDWGAFIWDINTDRQILELENVLTANWSPDGTRLALGMTDGTIRIWDVSALTQDN